MSERAGSVRRRFIPAPINPTKVGTLCWLLKTYYVLECTLKDVGSFLSFVFTSNCKGDLYCMLTNKIEVWETSGRQNTSSQEQLWAGDRLVKERGQNIGKDQALKEGHAMHPPSPPSAS